MNTEENIILYPEPSEVFTDPSLVMYFKPLLTTLIHLNGKPYKIHLVSTDGLICEEESTIKYSENYLFGFRYHQGIYEFLGNPEVFTDSTSVPALYELLQQDFLENRDQYIKIKKTVKEYLKEIRLQILSVPGFNDPDAAEYYAKAFYSYEFTKYYYQKYGVHRHISVVTEGWAKNTDPFLLDEEDGQDILEEFLMNMEDDSPHDYGLSPEQFAAGTERRRFVSLSGSLVLALADPEQDIIYMAEYGS